MIAASRADRIRFLRMRLHISVRMARYSTWNKGIHHPETMYRWDLVEELGSALHDQLLMKEMEDDILREKDIADGWDESVMTKTFDV
jgi:hypothetical protein